MPFDGKRMIFGGFEPVVEVKAWAAGATSPPEVPRVTGASGADCRPAAVGPGTPRWTPFRGPENVAHLPGAVAV